MLFEWDEKKSLKNALKHGIGFTSIDDFPWQEAVIFDRSRQEDGEQRYAAIAPLYGKLYTVIFTKRGVRTRIISLRRSNVQEERAYEKNKPNQADAF